MGKDNAKFDYYEFLEKGFMDLDEDFLNEHFGNQVKEPVKPEASSERLIPPTEAKKPNRISFTTGSFNRNILKFLPAAQKKALTKEGGPHRITIPWFDSETGESYMATLIFEGDLYYVEGIDELIQQGMKIGVWMNQGKMYFKKESVVKG